MRPEITPHKAADSWGSSACRASPLPAITPVAHMNPQMMMNGAKYQLVQRPRLAQPSKIVWPLTRLYRPMPFDQHEFQHASDDHAPEQQVPELASCDQTGDQVCGADSGSGGDETGTNDAPASGFSLEPITS